jgi:hypothetical protein
MLRLIPWPYRILALAALALTLIGYGWLKGAEHGEDKLNQHLALDAKEELASITKAAAKTAAMQLQKDKAIHDAAQREKTLRAAARAAGNERDGLRRELAQSRAKLSIASSESLRKRVAALEDVFEQCSERYTELAEKADRHASDALTLEQAWPK